MKHGIQTTHGSYEGGDFPAIFRLKIDGNPIPGIQRKYFVTWFFTMKIWMNTNVENFSEKVQIENLKCDHSLVDERRNTLYPSTLHNSWPRTIGISISYKIMILLLDDLQLDYILLLIVFPHWSHHPACLSYINTYSFNIKLNLIYNNALNLAWHQSPMILILDQSWS